MELRMKVSNAELLNYLSIIQDPRLERKKLHQLADILFIAVCASLCGCDTWEDIHLFATIREEWLCQYIELSNGVPSVDTIARVFSLIDPNEFETAFRNWICSLYEIKDGKIIAIDGKRVRGSYGNGKSAIHMVGAFAVESGLALAQLKTEEKSNEITASPKLLDTLLLKGCIITLDAMGCQKSIVKKIIARGGDYVISLKGNQGTLHDDVRLFLESEKKRKFEKTAHDYYETVEKGHGRVETRRYWITDQIDWLDNKENWTGLVSIGLVESERFIKGETSSEMRCFICSIKPNAHQFAQAVRQHWAIENNLHWQLDVTFDEDKLRARINNAAQNLSILRRMVLNTLKQEKSKGSLKGKRKKAGWSEEYLTKLLALLFKF
jgi:predicted transposase YbfD/YdcC